jgi:class 3 adenylate cyclase
VVPVVQSQRPPIPEPGALEIFAGVRPELLYGIAQGTYADRDVLFASGTDADRLIVLVWGHAGIHEGGVRIATRDPVCLLGEMAFIDGGFRSASVIAEGDVITYELRGDAVRALLRDPVFLRNLAIELTRKLREATQHRALRYAREEQLFGAFRRFVSPEVLNELLASGYDGRPRQAEVITMFADIRGFTAKTNVMPPEALFRDLGAFYEKAIRIIHDHGGMVDNLIGDEAMGIWGYNPRPDHADRAFEAAVALALETANLTLDGEPLHIGIGLEMGLVTLGVVGSEGKSSFTAIGPSVNLAARLQAETRRLGTTICLGPVLVGRLSEANRNVLTGPESCDIRGVGDIEVWTYAPKE